VRDVFLRLRSGHFPNRFENDWVTRHGEHRRLAWVNSAVPGADGSVELILGTGIDVTDRRLVERALAEVEQVLRVERSTFTEASRFTTLAAIAGDAIIALDRERRILSFSRGAAPARSNGRPPVPESE
jgi:PAS domain-containing protein